MINQNNPFYGSAGFTPMPGTSYAPQTGNYMAEKFGKKWSLRSFH